MKKLITLLAFAALPSLAIADGFKPGIFVEYGYAMFRYKSNELPVFLESYNSYNSGSLVTPFETKLKMATGTYWKAGIIGGAEGSYGMMSFTIYKAQSAPLSARNANGSGRDVWLGVRNSIFSFGGRFGGSGKSAPWLQANLNIGLQTCTVHSAYVFPDGSRSIGLDHTLNGSYSNFAFSGGAGLAAGWRIYGPLNVSASCDYMLTGARATPEHHQLLDNNDVGGALFLPRDMAQYQAAPYDSDNAISNDFRGLMFTFSVQIVLGANDKDN